MKLGKIIMGSCKLRRLHLPQNVLDTLEKQSINSCKDILSLSKLELQSMLGIGRDKIEKLLLKISKKCVSDPQMAYDLYMCQSKASGFLSLTLHSLDLLLQGGLPFGSITELTGPPGVGKTQFCFMLCLLTALPISHGGVDGQVIYIDTESAFSAQRLKHMAQNRFPNLCRNDNEIVNILQRILVHKVNSVEDLKKIIPHLEREIIRNKVKLIIMDSIASLMRKEFGTDGIESLMERNKILLEQAAILKDLAQTYNIVVFLTNQIASHLVDMETAHPDEPASDEEDYITNYIDNNAGLVPPADDERRKMKLQGMNTDHVIPALGNTWSHCVNTRLVAQFLDPSVRQLIIVKSPVAPNGAVRYTIDESGIVLTGDDIEFVNVSNQNILTKSNFLTSDITGTGVELIAGVPVQQNESARMLSYAKS